MLQPCPGLCAHETYSFDPELHAEGPSRSKPLKTRGKGIASTVGVSGAATVAECPVGIKQDS